MPVWGDSFTILSTSSLSGAFDTMSAELPTLAGGLVWQIGYHPTHVLLNVALGGDFNNDQVVDAADYVAWRKTDGTPSGYNAWRTNFGRSVGNGAGAVANTAVPEPTTLVMLTLALAGCRLRRRHE
jgi:hypothetical protein